MARMDMPAADSSVQPFQLVPSGFISHASPIRRAIVFASPAFAASDASTPSSVARQGLSTPDDETRSLSHVAQYVSVVPVMKPTRSFGSRRALMYFAGPSPGSIAPSSGLR